MNSEAYKIFVGRIKERFPEKSNLTNTLVELLNIKKEAVYRRMRGDVPFTFSEVMKISRHFDISLDALAKIGASKRRPFHLVMTEFVNPESLDLQMMEDYLRILQAMGDSENSVFVDCANDLPMPLYLKYYHISKFFVFKWAYMFGIQPHTVSPFAEFDMSPQLRALQEEHGVETRRISDSYYILDNLMFQYIVNDIQFFSSIRMLKREDIEILKKELLELVDEIDTIAARGRYEDTGKNVHFYVSNINFDTGYNILESPFLQVTLIKAFMLNAVSTLDSFTFEKMKEWISSLKRMSTLISESGAKQRINYIAKQREIIGTL